MNSWWLIQPTLKNMLVKLEIFPIFRCENEKSLKPPPSIAYTAMQSLDSETTMLKSIETGVSMATF